MKNIKKIVSAGILTGALLSAQSAYAYEVQSGDTMGTIANKHGISLERLRDLNPQVSNVNLIYPGDNIRTDGKSYNISKKEEPIQSTKQVISGGSTYRATAYTAYCAGCSGKTATGVNVRNSIYYKGYRIIAVDPNVIPLWSIVQLEVDGQVFNAVALDTGGAIKGNKVDLLVSGKQTASNFGVRQIKAKVIGSLR